MSHVKNERDPHIPQQDRALSYRQARPSGGAAFVYLEARGLPGAPHRELLVDLFILLRLQLDTTTCIALAKAAVATLLVMGLLSGHLTVAEVTRILHLLFG